jgi:hypothetical protein
VVTIEELLAGNSSGSGLESQEYGSGEPLRSQRDTLYPQKLTITSPASGCRSVDIVRSRFKAQEFFCKHITSSEKVFKCDVLVGI